MITVPKEITKGCHLLSLKEVQELEPKQLEAYNKLASAFVESFNLANPDGKAVKVDLKQAVCGELVNLVVAKNDNLSTETIKLPYVVVDRIGENIGMGDATGFVALTHMTLEPLQVALTVKAVNAGDEYQVKDGVRKYKCAAMVKLPETREEILLSDDARAIIAEMQKEVARASIIGNMKARRAKRTPERVSAATAPELEEADV